MPFPWKKKNRVTRLSRIVADLQSPKHGGSLVVETGFPTSLIDLFVKNRSRFTKPYSKTKKSQRPQISDPPPPSAITPANPPSAETSSSTDFTVVLAEAPSVTPLVTANVNGGDDAGVAGVCSEANRVGECDCGSGSKSVLAAFLKMFVVVVLIASVEKLTVGITMSAFALLFLEYLAEKRLFSFLRPCHDANMRIIEPLAQRISNCVWFFRTKKHCDGSESEEATFAEADNNIVVSELVVAGGGEECSSNSLSFDEIEVVETKSEVGGSTCEEKLGCPKMLEGSNVGVVDSCEISQFESNGNNVMRFKYRVIKKLWPRKLRNSKKESKAESPCSGKEDISIADEQGDVGKNEELESIGEDGVDDGITCCQESSLATVVVSENNRIGGIANSGYILSILFVIALAGLVVGRVPALILTMILCVMLKIEIDSGSAREMLSRS